MVTMNPKPCKYGCGTMMTEWDDTQKKYRDQYGVLHTQEICKDIKNKKGVADAANKAVNSSFTDKNEIAKIHDELVEIKQLSFAILKELQDNRYKTANQVSETNE